MKERMSIMSQHRKSKLILALIVMFILSMFTTMFLPLTVHAEGTLTNGELPFTGTYVYTTGSGTSKVEWTLEYSINAPAKATDAVNNVCTITDIKMWSDMNLTIPATFAIPFSVDEMAEMGVTVTKVTNRTVTVTGIGDGVNPVFKDIFQPLVLTIQTGVNVKNIPENAFKDADRMTKVVLPSVVSIGDSAFKNCANMTTINLPATLESIGVSAFEDSGLTAVTIPVNITEIKASTFKNCIKLNTLAFTKTSKCTSIGNSAFEGCTSLSAITGDGVANAFPVSLANIGNRAFYGCSNLNSNVTTGLISGKAEAANPVNTFEDRCLANRTGLQSIGSEAFKGCTSLRNFKLYNGSCNIANEVFDPETFIWSVKGSSVVLSCKLNDAPICTLF